MRIEQKFREIAERYPNNCALISEKEGEMTYQQLDFESDVLASQLSDFEDTIIGICVERSFAMIVSILAVLKCGKTYLPLDPTYPRERIQYMLEAANVKRAITFSNAKELLTCEHVLLDNINSEERVSIEDSDIFNNFNNEFAYILFTSGSTGVPNGVPIKHASIMNTLLWRIRYYNLCEKDMVLQVPSISFDSSVEDIFCTLLSGGCMYVLSEGNRMDLNYLAGIIENYPITHFLMVPSLYSELIERIHSSNKLRFVVLAGENFLPELAKKHYKLLEKVKLYNEYGPTENSVCSFVYLVEKSNDYQVLIGKNIDNVGYIIDYDQDGSGRGELYLSGVGLTDGYLNDEEKNKEKFVEIDNVRYYKTGDIVREMADGNLKFCGRDDQQIKLNGMRFELSEIDTNIMKVAKPNRCLTILCKNGFSENEVVTFYDMDKELNVQKVRDELLQSIPKQFIPKHYIKINGFRYLPNGKIDIKTLEKEYKKIKNNEVRYKNIEYENDILSRILRIFSEYLETEISENMYNNDVRDMGLDSLKYIRLLVDIEEEFEFEFGYDDIDNMKVFSALELSKYIKRMNS